MRIKKILLGLLICSVASSSIGCGNTKKTEEKVEVNTKLKGTITLWSYGSKAASLRETASNFKKKYPNASINVVELGEKEVFDNYSKALPSMNDLPDVVNIQGEYMPYLIKNYSDKLLELSQEKSLPEKDKFMKKFIGEASLKNKLYGMPYDCSPVLMFYKSDVFDSTTINVEDVKTWNNFIDTGRRLKIAYGNVIKLFPMGSEGTDEFYRVLLSQLGGSYVYDEEDNESNLKKSTDAMSLINEINSFDIALSVNSREEMVKAIKLQNVASIAAGSWLIGTLQQQFPEQKGKWKVRRLPAFKAGANTASNIESSYLTVSSQSKNKELALEFVKFAVTDMDSLSFNLKNYGIYGCYIPFGDNAVFDEASDYFSNEKLWRLVNNAANSAQSLKYDEHVEETKKNVISAQNKILKQKESVAKVVEELYLNMKVK